MDSNELSTETIIINKDNLSELSIMLETIERYVEKGGEVVIPRVISINDQSNLKVMPKNKVWYSALMELEKNEKKYYEWWDNIFMSFIIIPNKK